MDHIVAYLDRQVIDKTDLTGYFNIDLKFTPRIPSAPASAFGSESQIGLIRPSLPLFRNSWE